MARGQSTPPRANLIKHPSSSRSALRHATRLIHQVCCLAGAHTLIDEVRRTGAPNTLGSLIEGLDTPGLFNWLIDTLSYQGISDRVATAYIDEHGSITWAEIEYRLSKQPSCPKLKSYWHFHGCAYSKSNRTCACPDHYSRCPVPKSHLRNGRLNQTAYALALFIRDVANNDLVNWIDARLSQAASQNVRGPLYHAAMRESLLGPLRHVYGVGDKVLSMALASILLAAHYTKTHWHETGGSFIAVDTLVHNFLHRTGILKELSAVHAYGPRCYGNNGCAEIIEKIASRIDARQFNRTFPKVLPRFVQYAVWRYCSIDALNVCNGNRIDHRTRCDNEWCSLHGRCARLPISAE